MSNRVVMEGVREYGDGDEVELSFNYYNNRPTIIALNEARCACTGVDLLDVIEWVRANRPEYLNQEAAKKEEKE